MIVPVPAHAAFGGVANPSHNIQPSGTIVWSGEADWAEPVAPPDPVDDKHCTVVKDDGATCRGWRAKGTDKCQGHLNALAARYEAMD